ncbi:unnamed protein product, partial [Prorocentrum cordatum]
MEDDEDAELAEALRLSLAGSAPAAETADEDDDAELAEALRMSMGGADPEAKRPKVAPPAPMTDADLAAQLEKEDEPLVEVEFERFRGEDKLITDESVKEINSFCEQTGEQYVDPQFPPTSRSLYILEQDAATWQCFRCHSRSPLPPVPPRPTTEE